MRCPVVYPFPSAEAYLWLPAMLWWISPAAGVTGGSVESFLVMTSDWRSARARRFAMSVSACSSVYGSPVTRHHLRSAVATTSHGDSGTQLKVTVHSNALMSSEYPMTSCDAVV